MIGKIILDTSVVVAALRRAPGALDRLLEAEELLIPFIVLGELEYGAERSSNVERQREAIRTFMAAATLVMPTIQTAHEYGHLKSELAKKGTPLPENDVWIAAFACEHGLPLATLDEHFNRLSGMTILDWR